MRMAYQGEPGAYSEAAALRLDAAAEAVPCGSFDEVFAAVEGGRASHGILPIENSIGGSIHRNYDLLVAHELPIQADVAGNSVQAGPGDHVEVLVKELDDRDAAYLLKGAGVHV